MSPHVLRREASENKIVLKHEKLAYTSVKHRITNTYKEYIINVKDELQKKYLGRDFVFDMTRRKLSS